jgi:predicted nucleotidyltransferase
MLTRRTAIATAKSFIADLKTIGYNPSQAWLFGSVITGKTHDWSDIDLAVWDKKFTGILHLDGDKLLKLLVKYDAVELHTYSENATENEVPFIGEIKKTGERIL